MGPYRVHFTELEAFSRMANVKILPWEAMLIRRLCEVYMEVDDAKHKKQRPPTYEALMAELEEDEAPEPPIILPKGMTKAIAMTDIEGLKDFFRNLKPVKKRKATKTDGPSDDRPQS